MVSAHNHQGELIWEKIGGVRGHGFGVSPIVHGDLLIVPNDQEKGGVPLWIGQFNWRNSWKVPRASKRLTYSTPCTFFSKRKDRANLHQLRLVSPV